MNRAMISIVVLLTLVAAGINAKPLPGASPKSQGMSADRLARIVPIMQGYVDSGLVSGITTAVARHGKIVHLESVGRRGQHLFLDRSPTGHDLHGVDAAVPLGHPGF